ncbi:MAG: RidA family protein [Chlamydiota bacterium]
MKKYIFTSIASLTVGILGAVSADASPIQKIQTESAAKVLGNYSQAISVDLQKTKNLVFVAGQVAIDPATGELLEGDIYTATRQTLDNIEAILKASGSDWEHVVRMDVFLRDFNDWDGMNEEYAKRFPSGVFPARQTVEVGMENRVEISCIAVVPLNQ